MRQILRNCGADKIESVANASAAVQYCAYNHVDVVLCDYNLGEGKNGQHILEELRHKKLLKRSSLFLMVTGETSKEMVMGAREYQPDGYLTKPINRAMLEKRLGGLIAQRNALLPINREIDRENFPEAISLCLQTLPSQPRYKTWLMKTLADLYYQVGDFSHALKIHDDVLSQRDLSWARLGRGKILIANQNYDEAAATLESTGCLSIRITWKRMIFLPRLSKNRAGPPQAQQILEKAAEHSPNAAVATQAPSPYLPRPIKTCRQRPKPGCRPSALAPTRYTTTPNTILHWASHCQTSVKGTRQMRAQPMRTKL